MKDNSKHKKQQRAGGKRVAPAKAAPQAAVKPAEQTGGAVTEAVRAAAPAGKTVAAAANAIAENKTAAPRAAEKPSSAPAEARGNERKPSEAAKNAAQKLSAGKKPAAESFAAAVNAAEGRTAAAGRETVSAAQENGAEKKSASTEKTAETKPVSRETAGAGATKPASTAMKPVSTETRPALTETKSASTEKAGAKKSASMEAPAEEKTAGAGRKQSPDTAEVAARAEQRFQETAAQRPPRRRGKHAPQPQNAGELLDGWKSGTAKTLAAARYRLGRIPQRMRTIVSEKRETNFPESNRLLIQLFLLVWGMAPAVGARCREWMHHLRQRRHQKGASVKPHHPLREKKPQMLAFLGTAALVGLVALPLSLFTYGTTILYDGTPIATVDNMDDARCVLDQVAAAARSSQSEENKVDESLLAYSHSIVRRSELSTKEELLTEGLSDELGIVYGYSLYVDGALIGSTQYEGALEDLLDQMRQLYASESTISVEFKEAVEIREGYLSQDEIMNLGFIAAKLSSTKAGEETYTVAKGDTWGEIANNHGMSSVELQEKNPGYNINKIAIGETLTISNAVPYLTIVVSERQSYVSDIQYGIEYKDDASMFKGDEKVLSKGVYGSADVIATVTYVNGEETSRDIISSVTLMDPVTEVRARGTKERPSWSATGTFRWPASGRITSYFGSRNTGIRGASTNHQGLDIANSYGTAVYAADGGTVTYAGWQSSYGYLVKIDHGNGFVTFYAHNSRMLVSVGQHVYKGQQIARMGSTGVSSGNHCHFGVQRHGYFVNPLNYL